MIKCTDTQTKDKMGPLSRTTLYTNLDLGEWSAPHLFIKRLGVFFLSFNWIETYWL